MPTEILDKTQALQRTKLLLKREWKLKKQPVSTTNLHTVPPGGLGKNAAQIRALESPIENNDFADVKAKVSGHDLVSAKTVGELRDKIWGGIPDTHKQSKVQKAPQVK